MAANHRARAIVSPDSANNTRTGSPSLSLFGWAWSKCGRGWGGLERKHGAEVALEAQAAGRFLEAWQPPQQVLFLVSPPRRPPGTRLPGALANRAAQGWQVRPGGSAQGQACLCAGHVGLMLLSERPAVRGPRLVLGGRPFVLRCIHRGTVGPAPLAVFVRNLGLPNFASKELAGL